jgi:hypothetical protein
VLEKLIRKIAIETKEFRPTRKAPAKATRATAEKAKPGANAKRAARPSAVRRSRAATPRSRR